MLQRDESELVAYLAAHPSWTRLALRGAADPDAAQRALGEAGAAVCRIPHPIEPSDPLPNFCRASIDDGVPVLCLDVKDNSDYAERIVTAILGALDASGVDGRLEPWPTDPAASVPYERPAPRTIHGLLSRIVHEPGHPLLPLRAEPAGIPLADLDDMVPDARVEVDGAGVARLTELGQRDLDEHMRRRAAALVPLLDGIDSARLEAVRDTCLRLAGVDNAMLAGWRGFFGPLEHRELLVLETCYALTAARLGGMMPKRAWFDERWLATLRMHSLGETGLAEAEFAEVVPDADDWLDDGERAGALARADGIVRLTARGHQAAARYQAQLGGDPDLYDVCWSLVRKFRRATPLAIV